MPINTKSDGNILESTETGTEGETNFLLEGKDHLEIQ